jgi:hypothetical protein
MNALVWSAARAVKLEEYKMFYCMTQQWNNNNNNISTVITAIVLLLLFLLNTFSFVVHLFRGLIFHFHIT